MSTIVFVNPPYERIAPGYDFVRHITNRSPSLGLLHLAARARADGYAATIIESDLENLSPAETAARIIRLQPRYLGLTLFTVGVMQAAEIARLVKTALPETVILIGGPHVSSLGRETLQHFAAFDLAVVQEGEFCDTSTFGARVRYYSPQTVFELLSHLRETYYPCLEIRDPLRSAGVSPACGLEARAPGGARISEQRYYGVRHVQFVDDLFVASRSRVAGLCGLITRHKPDITWSCTARVDTVTPDVLKQMKAAGCWEISFGLESGADSLLQAMQKSADTAKAERAVQYTHAAGIRCKGLLW